MKFTREVKTGILAVCAIALLIFGYSFLKGKNLLESDRIFYVVYENVEGLVPSSPVTINGLQVGKVTAINFADAKGNLIVEFTANNKFDFSKNSLAKVYGGGLIGGKSLAIAPVYDKARLAKSGDTLPGTIEEGLLELVNDRLTPLQEKLELTIVSADSVLTSVNGVLSSETQNNINSVIADLSIAMRGFKGSANTLNGVLSQNKDKLNRTFTNIDEMSTKMNRFSDTLSQINLNKLTKDLDGVLVNFKQISAKLDNGTGTAGKLLNDKKLYDNLEKSTKQLELLLQDFRLNPKRYVHISVFGKNNKPYEKPEETQQ